MLVAVPVASAERRVALVVGNSAYQYTSKLDNPKNDAGDMGAALKHFSFDVVEGFDLDKTGFERKLRDFSLALRQADIGVFFYAGHGLQVAGENYLVPVDAKLENADALDWEMVKLDLVYRTMERATNTNILFLDACRNNPLARNLARALGTRAMEVGRGLAPVESGVGSLISFSTRPGDVALDGTGRNSPFSGALVRRLLASKEDLNSILIDVRNDVMKATADKQVPWEHSALRGRFYFAGAGQTALAPPAVSTPSGEAAEAWRAAERTNTIAAFEAFIRRFGDTYYGDLAKTRLSELKRAAEAEAARKRAEEDARAKAERERLAAAEEALRQKAFEAEKKARAIEQAKLNGRAVVAERFRLMDNTRLIGGNATNTAQVFMGASLEQVLQKCHLLCLERSNCRAFNVSLPMCNLLSSVDGSEHQLGALAGIRK
jgi:uncharacterized caspase-like protein